MTINLCVNGTFRYPTYVRHYEEAGLLNAFYFAHRRSTVARSLGLRVTPCRNGWAKEYLLQAAYRLAPAAMLPHLAAGLCDLWQADVIRHWRHCETVEAVIGATADRVIAHAKRQGSRVLGHPVTTHPLAFDRAVGRAYAQLGLDPAAASLPHLGRRLAEIAGCDRLVVDSDTVARSFIAEGVSAERIAVVTPGVDLARFRPLQADEDRETAFRVVCVGMITPRKGQHVLLEAWRRLALRRAELVLVGVPGRDADAVVRGYRGSFTHLRGVPNAALRDLLVRASVFVAPSIEDGFAQAPLEAMACGTPVVVSANVGMSDLVTDGIDGFVVPAFDPGAIAERVELLCRDRPRALAMGQAAAQTARRIGPWKSYVTRVLAEHRALRGHVDPITSEAA